MVPVLPDVCDRQQGIPTGRVGKMFNVCVGWVKVWDYQMDRLRMPILKFPPICHNSSD